VRIRGERKSNQVVGDDSRRHKNHARQGDDAEPRHISIVGPT
jgi:hypothetical protein